MQNMKGNPLMEKKGPQKNPRVRPEILVQVVVGLGKVERWLQVLEMMVVLKGVLTWALVQILSFFKINLFWLSISGICSAESGTEGSSEGSDENANHQVCAHTFGLLLDMCALSLG